MSDFENKYIVTDGLAAANYAITATNVYSNNSILSNCIDFYINTYINRANITGKYPSIVINRDTFASMELNRAYKLGRFMLTNASNSADKLYVFFYIMRRSGGIACSATIGTDPTGATYTIAYRDLEWGNAGIIYTGVVPSSGVFNGFISLVTGATTDRIGFAFAFYTTDVSAYQSYGQVFGMGMRLSAINTRFGHQYDMESIEFSPSYGEASQEGGYSGGTFDDSSDTIGIPATPSLGVTSAGFVNVYNPSAGALQNLGAELFPDLTFTPDAPISGTGGVTEAIEAMATALVNFGNQIPNIVNMYINSNLIQYVIDCHILPVAPSVGASENIKIGFKTFTPTATRVTSDYVDFDCGNLSLGEFYANFIDYAPYTRAKLFLPFVGFVDIAPEYWQSGNLNVVYRFNIIDGSFMAFVKSTSSKSKLSDTVIAQYGGNACVHIPLTGLNYSSMVSGVVSAAAAVVSAQSGVQAASKAIGGAVDVMNSKPPVQQSNGYNATTSFLGVRTPYLLIERSVSNFSASYAAEKGIPSNISTSFANLSGFTTATDIHLDGITGATEAELNEIARLLSEGVIL